MDIKYQINYETPEAIYELAVSVMMKDTSPLTKLPSEHSLALARAINAKHGYNMDEVWNAIDELALVRIGRKLSPKYRYRETPEAIYEQKSHDEFFLELADKLIAKHSGNIDCICETLLGLSHILSRKL